MFVSLLVFWWPCWEVCTCDMFFLLFCWVFFVWDDLCLCLYVCCVRFVDVLLVVIFAFVLLVCFPSLLTSLFGLFCVFIGVGLSWCIC